MAWIYLAAVEDSPKGFTGGLGQSLTVKSTLVLSACSCPEWRAETWRWLRSGMTCARCEGLTCRRWILSLADSPARTSLLQDLERAWKASEADLYLNTSDSLASADPSSSSWKTYQLSLFGGLTEFSWDSMRWGMMRGGQLFQPQKWEPRTCENESGFLPTPRASDGEKGGPNQAQHGQPSLVSIAVNWPTPQARDWKDGLTPWPHGRHSPSVAVAGHQGYLNPAFVEVMMGWPIGSTVSESWVTESSHFARKSRSNALQVSNE